MRATSTPSQTTAAPGVKAPPPPADAFVTISRQEHIALKSAAHYWQTLHRKAVARFQWRELRYQRILRELKAAGVKSNAALQAELDLARGQVRDLQKRVFASKSERRKHCENQTGAATRRRWTSKKLMGDQDHIGENLRDCSSKPLRIWPTITSQNRIKSGVAKNAVR